VRGTVTPGGAATEELTRIERLLTLGREPEPSLPDRHVVADGPDDGPADSA
jgi:hypothetical protein